MQTRLKQQLYRYAGWGCFGLGVIGAFLPLMPTVLFWIIAVWLWSRGSPELLHKVYEHPQFGDLVRQFIEYGVISRRGKFFAVLGMSIGFVVFLLSAEPAGWLIVLVASCLLSVAVWIVSRPRQVPVSSQ